jgi:Helix-turn-helix domain
MKSATKKQNRKAVRERRAKRRFAFLKQMRRDTTLSSSAKMVVWSLADDSYNLDDERCNPGLDEIAKNVGRSLRPTKQAIKEAKDAGWITFTSTHGGSKRCTNRYTPVWDKVHSAKAEKPSAQPIDDTIEEGKFTEIIEENEKASAVYSTSSANGKASAVNRQSECCRQHTNLTEPQRGEEEGEASAACGFAAPLKKEEEEEEFGQLCEAWQVREQWHPSVDMAKAREAFAALEANHGDEIRAQGVSVGYYLLARAQVWIAEINSPEFLPKLEAWLGMAPGFKGEVVQWWRKRPRQMGGGHSAKPDFLKLGLGRRAS